MKEFISIINAVIIAGVILVGIFMALPKVDTFLKTQAITGCYGISRYEKTSEDGVTVSYPMPEIYKQCLTATGFEGK